MQTDTREFQYAGFWIRVGASIIDTIILILTTMPLMMLLYGAQYWSNPEVTHSEGFFDFLINYILPAVYAIAFWVYKSATPYGWNSSH